jgi:hypothetical protein
MRMIFGRWSQVKTSKRAEKRENRWTKGIGLLGVASADCREKSQQRSEEGGKGEGMAEGEGMGARDWCIRVLLLDRP